MIVHFETRDGGTVEIADDNRVVHLRTTDSFEEIELLIDAAQAYEIGTTMISAALLAKYQPPPTESKK